MRRFILSVWIDSAYNEFDIVGLNLPRGLAAGIGAGCVEQIYLYVPRTRLVYFLALITLVSLNKYL